MAVQVLCFCDYAKKYHKESRLLFVREAKKLYQKEFVRWFGLTSEINPLLRFFRAVDIKAPTLYGMGKEDYLFLPTIKKMASESSASELFIVENCGHVVNVEQPLVFNTTVIAHLSQMEQIKSRDGYAPEKTYGHKKTGAPTGLKTN